MPKAYGRKPIGQRPTGSGQSGSEPTASNSELRGCLEGESLDEARDAAPSTGEQLSEDPSERQGAHGSAKAP